MVLSHSSPTKCTSVEFLLEPKQDQQIDEDNSSKHETPLVEFEYGGSLANHYKFLLQVVQAVAAAISADQVVVGISPAIDDLDTMELTPQPGACHH
ncbi:hypothetical protein L1987_47994 [Smallanthus sonchifolius]|uniref:Uncharacterized protein n=1 Tax=Smallanthus sonchifolius TaxID=185202 RepID=A0ACB9FRL7_9ASTR|nr:hypothetical protein L1987_47994 [Smallanthus sonchifolius]